MSTYKDPMQYATMEGLPGASGPFGQQNLAQLNNRQSAAIKGDILEKELAKHRQTYGTEGIVAANPERVTTYGEKAVGLTFNPSGHSEVYQCKKLYAQIIDQMHGLRVLHGGISYEDREIRRLAEIAITEAQTAQMWAVKALTWRD